MKRVLFASAEDVAALQDIRDRRLAGQDYFGEKLAFFKSFRERHGIKTTSPIKIETENPKKLGVVQYAKNNHYIKV